MEDDILMTIVMAVICFIIGSPVLAAMILIYLNFKL